MHNGSLINADYYYNYLWASTLKSFPKNPFRYLTEIKLNRYHFPQVWWYVIFLYWFEVNAHLQNIHCTNKCIYTLYIYTSNCKSRDRVCICLRFVLMDPIRVFKQNLFWHVLKIVKKTIQETLQWFCCREERLISTLTVVRNWEFTAKEWSGGQKIENYQEEISGEYP